jgi:hypothetical protein
MVARADAAVGGHPARRWHPRSGPISIPEVAPREGQVRVDDLAKAYAELERSRASRAVPLPCAREAVDPAAAQQAAAKAGLDWDALKRSSWRRARCPPRRTKLERRASPRRRRHVHRRPAGARRCVRRTRVRRRGRRRAVREDGRMGRTNMSPRRSRRSTTTVSGDVRAHEARRHRPAFAQYEAANGASRSSSGRQHRPARGRLQVAEGAEGRACATRVQVRPRVPATRSSAIAASTAFSNVPHNTVAA